MQEWTFLQVVVLETLPAAIMLVNAGNQAAFVGIGTRGQAHE